MKNYETMIVFDSALEEEKVSTKLQEVERRVGEGGGEMASTDRWGKRKLAYPMGRKEQGQYVLLKYSSAGSQIAEIDRVLRLDETVLRHMTVVGPDEALVQAAAQAAERAAQRRTRARDDED
ncbi:MAG: 30S ribosomal protein S6 [Gemmatimonadetes bacterium]|nr:30S ribosomal protein S6 [Gemmatimonadota bacterium]